MHQVFTKTYQNEPTFFHTFVKWSQRVAAILILPSLLMIAWLLMKDTTLVQEEAYQEVFSSFGSRSKLDLPDGSTVWLNAGTRIKFPIQFLQPSRKVFIEGEAYFEIESDKEHPFIVVTDELEVVATGTKFNVEAYKKDTSVAVTLLDGIVDVSIDEKSFLNMQPSQRVSYSKNSKTYQLSNTETYKWVAWKDGVLAFRDDRLDYIFKKIGLMYNIDIEVKDASIASYLFRATFDDESLDNILHLLQMSAPIRYVHTKRTQNASGIYSKEKIEVYKERK